MLKRPRDTNENMTTTGETETKKQQLDLLREESRSRKIVKLQKTRDVPRNKIEASMDQQRKEYQKKLTEMQAKRVALEQSGQEIPDGTSKLSLTTGDNYTYERSMRTYIDSSGVYTAEITINIKKDDGAPVEATAKYSGEASSIARMCNAKMDGFIQNNYHDVLAQAKRKIEEEMAPQYTALGATPDAAARDSLDAKRDQKIAEAEKKASASLRKFLDKYGNRSMDVELLEELQWVQGIEAAARDIKSRAIGAENKLNANAEALQEITTEINDKIQEIKQIIPSSSTPHTESRERAGSSRASSSEASHLEHDTITLENFDKKIEAYLHDHSNSGLSDTIYKEIVSLATDESKYPENIGAEDRLKIRKALLDTGLNLVKRQYKLEEPSDMLEVWQRYTASHYGKRLVYERQLVDHFEAVAREAGEHARAIHQENELIKEVDKHYKAAGNTDLPPIVGDHYAAIKSSLEQLQDKTIDQTEREQHINNLVELYPQIQATKGSNDLQISLKKLEEAHLYAAETKGKYEQAKTFTDKLQRLIEQEKGRDDVNDMIELSKTNAIKKIDETSLQHARAMELEMVKHFYARKLEDHKLLNKEEDELRHYLISLDKAEIANKIQQKRLITMYWLSLFGSGDQAALMALGRESGAEFNSFMNLFR
ncbi:MAG TPA: hypothetical protein VL485_03365 [Ktedonobacteraceae bacterium]|jgi:hypothetical protein|nr:hypothetical protein [Ktedonobacteraceae bacterium]